MPSLVVFSRDPGPTNHLVAALDLLRGEPPAGEPEGLSSLRDATRSLLGSLHVIARPPGEAIWKAGGYEPVPWRGNGDAEAEALLRKLDAGVVITGAEDVDEPGNRALWRAARARGVDSHVLLDHPANLAERFVDGDRQRMIPDWLYVSDTVFAARLAAAGVPEPRIRIVGDIHHARMVRLAGSRSEGDRSDLRSAWGAGTDDTVVLFASECAREMAAKGRPSPYDEIEVLTGLLRLLADGRCPGRGSIDPARTLLVVRPHPRDLPGKYDAAIAAGPQGLRVVVSSEGAADVTLLAVEIVAGMNSSLLYEALALGRVAVSLTGHDISAGKSMAG